MTTVTVQLTEREIKTLKAAPRGETPRPRGKAAGKGRRFATGRRAIRWLES
jgi:hypothetical protein